MTRFGLACAFLVLGCRPATSSPKPVSVEQVPQGRGADASGPRSASARASIAFLERPGGVLEWDFEVRGLPAVDTSSGAIIVADVSHGQIASSLAMSIQWLRPGEPKPLRTLPVLDASAASRVLYEIDASEEPAEIAKLAQSVRARTLEANDILAAAKLRSLTPCDLPSNDAAAVCAHPQRLVCGALEAELRGDVLSWHSGAQTGTAKTGWAIAPMTIGDGPPKEMVTCIEEAHFDPVAMQLAARIMHACRGGGSDACFLPDEWRAIELSAQR